MIYQKLLVILMFVILGGCSSYSLPPSHEFLEPDTKHSIITPPECVATELNAGFKEACLEDLEGYQIYLDRYLSEAYSASDVVDPTAPPCSVPISMPVLQPQPIMNADTLNKTDEELIDQIAVYTDRLELYIADTINRYNQQIINYNAKCSK